MDVKTSEKATTLRPCIAALALCLTATGCDPQSSTAAPTCQLPLASDMTEATELYLDAWQEADEMDRICSLERSLDAEAVLLTNRGVVQGRTAVAYELNERISDRLGDGSIREFPDGISTRHQEAILSWSAAQASGAVQRGEDWLEFSDEGLVARVHILAGSGAVVPLSESLVAWQEAWNASDADVRAQQLRRGTTPDVRFTDAIVDLFGRDSLRSEIERQSNAVGIELYLDKNAEVFASEGDEPVVLRVPAEIQLDGAASLRVIDYVRLRDGKIERLSGFPARSF